MAMHRFLMAAGLLASAFAVPGMAVAEEAANGIPGARLEVVKGCGHLVPLEAEEELLEALLKLLQ